MISHATNMAQLRKHPRFVHGHAANGASPNYMGQRKSVAQWCNELGLSQSTVRNRIFRGNTAEVIFSPTKLPKGTYLELDGKRANLSEWAKITGISAENISNRLAWGWPVRKALTQSVSQDHWAGKTHCANGHRLVPENIKVRTRRGQQHRECKQCRSERKKRARQAKAV